MVGVSRIDLALQPVTQTTRGCSVQGNTSPLTHIRGLFQNFSYTCSYAQTQGVSTTHVSTTRPVCSVGWVLLALHCPSRTTAGCHRLLCKTLHFRPKLSGHRPQPAFSTTLIPVTPAHPPKASR